MFELEADLTKLGRAWIRNGVKRNDRQLVSCGRILLDRLGVDMTPGQAEVHAVMAAVRAAEETRGQDEEGCVTAPAP